MPAIASHVKGEGDAFYWHLGDFRAMGKQPDQDLAAMQPAGQPLSTDDYYRTAWDDFLNHQIKPFDPLPVFLGRGNHETYGPGTRDSYIAKFQPYLDRSEIEAQRKTDGADAAPIGPWYHWIHNGVDFITLDNASQDEFSDAQLRWLRSVLDHDLAPHSGVHSIVAGMHEALPHSSSSAHAMDDWALGERTGELVYTWMYDAQAAGKHVYLIASHSHYYSPDIFDTPFWRERGKTVVPGIIVGTAGAHRYILPPNAPAGSKTFVYGWVQGVVHPDGAIDLVFHQLSEEDLIKAKWPNAPQAAIHDCVVNNRDVPSDGK